MIKIMRIDEFAHYGVNEMAVKGSSLANYDEVDIFDSKYFLVKKWIGGYQRDQYNLADRNGNLISEIWFDKIEKNDDGSIVVNKDNEREKDVTYSSVGELVKNVKIMDAAIDAVLSVQDIPLTDTYPLTPYQITDKNTNTKKTIIARATLDSKEVFIGDDGKLYNADGSEYKIEIDYDSINDELENYIIEELYGDTDYDSIWLADIEYPSNQQDGFVATDVEQDYNDIVRVVFNIDMNAFKNIYCKQPNAKQSAALKRAVGIDLSLDYDYAANFNKFKKWLTSNLLKNNVIDTYDGSSFFVSGTSSNNDFEFNVNEKTNICYSVEVGLKSNALMNQFVRKNGTIPKAIEYIKETYAFIVNEVLKVFDKELCQKILKTSL